MPRTGPETILKGTGRYPLGSGIVFISASHAISTLSVRFIKGNTPAHITSPPAAPLPSSYPSRAPPSPSSTPRPAPSTCVRQKQHWPTSRPLTPFYWALQRRASRGDDYCIRQIRVPQPRRRFSTPKPSASNCYQLINNPHYTYYCKHAACHTRPTTTLRLA